MANVIAQLNKPTLVLAHNKTLAAQLYGEMKEFFPCLLYTSVYSRMYPALSEIQEYLDKDGSKPFLLVEYCHSMGLSLIHICTGGNRSDRWTG